MTATVRSPVEPGQLDPFVDGFVEDPYSHYAEWRAREPVHWGRSPDERGAGCWYVLDHASAAAALADDRLGLELARAVGPEHLEPSAPEHAAFVAMIGRWMIFRDPPDHTRLRRAMMPAFGRRAVAELGPVVEAVAGDLVASALAKERFDLIADIALPLPVIIVGRMLGFTEVDYPMLKRCSHALLAGIDLKRADCVDRVRHAAAEAAEELSDYLRFQIARRRSDRPDDLLGRLVAATGEGPDGDEELVANCALLLFAGHETTTNLIGNGMRALLRNQAAQADLRRDPGLLRTAIEELARFDSPSQMTFRFVMESLILGGKELRPGEPVGIVIGAANRDPAVFAEPDRLDLARAPNPHLSFGLGRHCCPGTTLARLEAEAVFRQLLASGRALGIACPDAAWSGSIGLRGLRHLWLVAEDGHHHPA